MNCRLAALGLLLLWGGVKLPWEKSLAAQRERVMYGAGASVSPQLRDSLGQGLSMAALGGFRGVAANFLWISLTEAWQERQWSRVQTYAELSVLLQPRVVFFWEMGAWNLAWNASMDAQYNGRTGGISSRNRDARMWVEAGRDLLERGLSFHPEKYNLYRALGDLYWQRLQDYNRAAEYYLLAAAKPGAPAYLERFAGRALEEAGRKQDAYVYWKTLWLGTTDHGPGPRRWDVIEKRIRKLETELNIPLEKKLFPR